MKITSEAKLRYKFERIRDGKLIKSKWSKFHLITDAGLDKVASNSWLACVSTPIIGEGVSPTAIRRDSGGITFTQAGTTLTASAGFFSAADVGRLFKWGTGTAGNEIYITGFTSTTIVTVGTSATVGTPEIGTIWYVNTALLQTPITGLTWTKNNDALENFSTAGTSGDTCTVTNQTVFYSSALAGPKTVSEIAFSHNNTNSNVFDRDLVTPTVALLTADQAKITLQLIIKWSPITDVAVGNVATGYDSSGNVRLESLGMSNLTGISHWSSSGGISGGGNMVLEPVCSAVPFGVRSTNTAFQAFNAITPNNTGTFLGNKTGTTASYGTGNRYIDSSVTFSISEVNGTLYDVSIGNSPSGGSLFRQKFTASFTKLSTQTLAFTFRKSWSRTLTN